MTRRLWDKGAPVDDAILAFTVGDDPVIDRELVGWECQGSAAQARMLGDVGLLTGEEALRVVRALAGLAGRGREGTFDIPPELEDVHSAIEAALVESLGEVGKKIHAGRSRNDQIILTTRLWLRNTAVELLLLLARFGTIASKRFDEIGSVPMPGYSHMLPAMPSSVGMWLHAIVEATLELMREGIYLLSVLNVNPLGAAAGFGSTLPIDRARTAELLGFDGIQRSVIDVQNSRGRFELKALRWGADIGSMCEKLACDLMLYSMRELGYVSIPDAFTTGSSIMPQKRNPDVLELSRARASRIRGAESELVALISKLPSSYHRDFQYTKGPTLRGMRDAREVLEIMALVVDSLSVDRARLANAMYPELYATYEAFRRVRAGTSFRDAYRQAAELVEAGKIDRAELEKDFDQIATRTLKSMNEAREELSSLESTATEWSRRLERIENELFSE